MIKIQTVDEIEIEDFGNSIGKDVIVIERAPDIVSRGVERFYSHLEDVEVKDECILIGASGNGDTPEEAIRDYCNSISCKLIVVDAFKEDKRKVLKTPKLKFSGFKS